MGILIKNGTVVRADRSQKADVLIEGWKPMQGILTLTPAEMRGQIISNYLNEHILNANVSSYDSDTA